jgi:hypothetical protein
MNKADNFSLTFPNASGGFTWDVLRGNFTNTGGQCFDEGASDNVALTNCGSNTGYVELTISTRPVTDSSAVDGLRLVLRGTDADNYWFMEILRDNRVLINKKVGGMDQSPFYSDFVSTTVGSIFRFSVTGNTFTAFRNGAPIPAQDVSSPLTVIDSFNSTATNQGFAKSPPGAWSWDNWQFVDNSGGSSISLIATPVVVPRNHNGPITLNITGTGTNFTGSTVFTVAGVANVTKISQSIIDTTHATLTITTGAGTGVLTVAETITGTANATITVAIPTLSVSPNTGPVNSSVSLTITSTNTIWTQETPSSLFTNVTSIVVSSVNQAAATLATGSTEGTIVITDNSTGITANFTVSNTSGGGTINDNQNSIINSINNELTPVYALVLKNGNGLQLKNVISINTIGSLIEITMSLPPDEIRILDIFVANNRGDIVRFKFPEAMAFTNILKIIKNDDNVVLQLRAF